MRVRPLVRVLVLGAIAATLAACSSSLPFVGEKSHSKEYFSERTYGPASPRVVTAGPMPRGGGHAVTGVAYNVAGKTYTPTDTPNTSEVGLASWYGDAFHGRLTANGEVYDVNGLTAAHPTFPLPSYVRVTDLENGRSIIVRVNDRGPFASDRIIDVSERVAGILGFQDEGTAKVKLDYIGPARMDGQDDRMLLASYKGPAIGGGNSSMFAWLQPKPNQVDTKPPVVLASATAPLPRIRPLDTYPPKAASSAPMAIDAFGSDDDSGDDPLAPLILRSSMVTSYASQAPLTAAQGAANALAGGGDIHTDLASAARRAAARMDGQAAASEVAATMSGGATIQLGAFGDPANASRIAASFGRFGSVQAVPGTDASRPLTVIRVALNAGVDAGSVLDAAKAAGLSGAFI
ncbi:MAG TPA: septal ring lytic transglycosylase RlpA family protein, partial [Bauldia sp.]|nr:septal ring lytic transglycosylase RlpA family protein [Bauldia sp.]